MNEFKRKLEETLNRLYKENKLSIDAYSELMEFANPNQNLQLQQTGVMARFSENRGFPSCSEANDGELQVHSIDFNGKCFVCGKQVVNKNEP